MQGTRLVALALAATTLVASGCGGSTTSSSNTRPAGHTQSVTNTGPLTPTGLIARADAICYGVNAKRASSVITSKQDITHVLPQLAAYERTALAQLEKLVPPASMVSDWKLILARTQVVAEDTAKLAGYANTNPHLLGGRPVMLDLVKAQEELVAAARRNNFKDCAQIS